MAKARVSRSCLWRLLVDTARQAESIDRGLRYHAVLPFLAGANSGLVGPATLGFGI